MKKLILIFIITVVFTGCKKSDDGTAAIAGGNTTAAFTFNTVTGANGRVWMDRNLGATQVATSSTDVNSYGDLYQWGRGTDGHQKRTAATTSTLSSSDVPGHSNFIIINTKLGPDDWRSPQNNNLWQGVNGVNNPCPSGYRLPTVAEWEAEIKSWGSKTAFQSALKLPMAGFRAKSSIGVLSNVGTSGGYWSSTVSGSNVHGLMFDSSKASMVLSQRSPAICVRCIKD